MERAGKEKPRRRAHFHPPRSPTAAAAAALDDGKAGAHAKKRRVDIPSVNFDPGIDSSESAQPACNEGAVAVLDDYFVREPEISAAASSGSGVVVPDDDAAVACLATRVRNFYLLHSPEKADGATKVARRYVGFPHTLNERLVALYGVGLGPSVPDLVERIEAGRSEPPQTLPRAAGGVELAAAGGVHTRNPASRPKEGKGRV